MKNKLNKTNGGGYSLKAKKLNKQMTSGLLALLICLVVFFVFLGGIFISSSLSVDNSLSDTGNRDVVTTGDKIDYDGSELPANTIENIWDGSNFNLAALDKVANLAGANDMKSLLDDTSWQSSGNYKTATDMMLGGSEWTIKFGSYTFNGTTYDLEWFPVYLSTTTASGGTPILTLWLKSVQTANGTVSNQELSVYKDSWNGNNKVTPASNDYYTAELRVKTLNIGGNYYGSYNNSGSTCTPKKVSYTATSDGTNKFEMLTTGALKNYIVTPANVAWQVAENYMKNDISYTLYTSLYTTGGWKSDPIWLPSVYEAVNSSITVQTQLGDFDADSGLWKTSKTQRTNNNMTSWLRSARDDGSAWGDNVFINTYGGANSNYVNVSRGVRPALHLNLQSSYDDAVLEVPTDTSMEYNANPYTTDLAFAKTNWFYSNYYTDASKISVSFSLYDNDQPALVTANGTSVPQDAGKYYATFKLVDTSLTWSDGTPSSSSIKIVFTITKKKIVVDVTGRDSNGYPTLGTINDEKGVDITTLGYTPPDLCFKYKRSDNLYDKYTVPIAGGTYTATLHFDDDDADKVAAKTNNASGVNGNYKFDTTTTTFTLADYEVDIPTVPSYTAGNYTYDQTANIFSISNMDESLVSAPTIKKSIASSSSGDMVYTAGTPASADGTVAAVSPKLTVTNAGDYTITFALADKTGFVWKGTTSTADQQISISIAPVTLSLVYSITDSSGKSSSALQWSKNTQQAINVSYSGNLSGENVTFTFSHDAEGGGTLSQSNLDTVNKTIVITGPSVNNMGTYNLTATLPSNDINNNYKIDSSGATTFKIVGTSVSGVTLTWLYSNNSSTPAKIPSSLAYNGYEYKFTVDPNSIPTGLAVDTSRVDSTGVENIVGGYVNNAATNAGTYTAKVYLKASSASYTFDDSNNPFTYTYTIDKAKYDMSKIAWDYDSSNPPKYTGSTQSVTLKTDNSWKGLTATYTDNVNIVQDAGTYKTEVEFNWDTQYGTQYSNNYVLPEYIDLSIPGSTNTTCDNASSFAWTLTWTIDKATIDVSTSNWKDKNTVTSLNGTDIDLPALKLDSTLSPYIDYTVYEYDAAAAPTYKGKQMDITQTDIKPGVEYKVVIEASINKTAVANNYKFSSSTPIYVYTINDKRKKVLVELDCDDTYTYSGNIIPAKVSAPGYARESDLIIRYVDSNGDEYENIKDAGVYSVKVYLPTGEETDYVIPSTNNNFKFTINPKPLDVSKVKWNYDSAKPFEYKMEYVLDASGNKTVDSYGEYVTQAAEQEVKLENLPTEIENIIVYTGNHKESAISNTYSCTYDITKLGTNYKLVDQNGADVADLSKYAATTINWEIKAREFTALSTTANEYTFDGVEKDFAALVGLPADWALYFDLSAERDNVTWNVTEAKATNVGNYVFTFTVKSQFIAADGTYSVYWTGGDSKSYSSTWNNINTLEISVTGWKDKPAVPVIGGSADLSKFYSVDYYNDTTKIDVVQAGSIYDTPLTAEIVVADAMKMPAGETGDNVKFVFSDGVSASYQFVNFKPTSSPKILTKPTISTAKITYTGDEVDVASLFTDYDPEYMELTGNVTGVKDAGTYTVKVSINGLKNAKWTDKSTDTYTYTFTIDKATVPNEWTYDQGILTIKADDTSMIEYEYYDDTGALVPKESLSYEQTYTVKAILKSADQGNYGFNGTSQTYISETFVYHAPTKLVLPELANGGQLTYTGSAQTIGIVIDPASADFIEYDATELTATKAGQYTVTIKIKSGAYAVWDNGNDKSDKVLTYEIAKESIDVKWDTSSKVPEFVVPKDIDKNQITVKYYDVDGNEVTADQFENGESYTAVAIVDDDQDYMMNDTGAAISDAVDFTYTVTYLWPTKIVVADGFPVWQLYLIILGLIIAALETFVGVRNLQKNKKLNEEWAEKFPMDDDDDDKSYSRGGGIALLAALLAADSGNGFWTIIALVVVALVAAAFIFMVVTARKQSKSKDEMKSAEKKYKKRKADEEKQKQLDEKKAREEQAEAERLLREKEEREEERRAVKEEREAERARQEKADEQKQMMMMMMMKGGSGGSSGGGGGGGYYGGGGTTAIPYPVPYAQPVQNTAPQSDNSDDIVTKVIAAIQPTLQSQQQQMTQQQVKSLEEKIAMQSQQLNQHQQDDRVKALEDQLAQHKQEQQASQQNDRFKQLEDKIAEQQKTIARHKQQQAEQEKLAEQQQLTRQQIQQELADKQAKDQAEELAKQDEERNQAFTKYMLDRSDQAARDAEQKKQQQTIEQIKALEEQIQQQRDLIENMRIQGQQPTANTDDKTSQILESLQKMLKEQIEAQSQEQSKLVEEQLKKQTQLIEELRAKDEQRKNNDKPEREDTSSKALEQLQVMLQQQLAEQQKLHEQQKQQADILEQQIQQQAQAQARVQEQQVQAQAQQLAQQKLEQENKLARQQAELEQKQHELTQRMYEQQLAQQQQERMRAQEQQAQRQQELQARQQDQSREQIKELEAKLAQQKEEQAKLLEQQKLEQERLLEKQRQEQEKKFEELKSQKDQAELLAELRMQREPVKQDDATSKILEEHSKTLEQIAKQQAEMQAQQKVQEQERQRKELEQKINEQAEKIKELEAKNGVVPSNDDKTAKYLEQLVQLQTEPSQLQQPPQPRQTQQVNKQPDYEMQRLLQSITQRQDELEKLIKEQSRLLAELHSSDKNSVPLQNDDNTAKILAEHSKTLEQITQQQAELQEKQKAKEEAQKQKELEDLIKEQARRLEELKYQSNYQSKSEGVSYKDDDKATKILEQQSRTLEEQGKTLEQIARQQGKTLERLAEQQSQKPIEVQPQQTDLQSQQLVQRQADLQARQLAQEQADLQARQNAKQQALLEQQARELEQKQAELQAQQLARQQAEMQAKQYAQQYANQQALLEQQARELAQKQAELQAQQQAQQLAQKQAELQAQQLAQKQAELQAQQLAQQRQVELQSQQQEKLLEQQLVQVRTINDVPTQDELLKKSNLTKK